jgi:hypothetical protein
MSTGSLGSFPTASSGATASAASTGSVGGVPGMSALASNDSNNTASNTSTPSSIQMAAQAGIQGGGSTSPTTYIPNTFGNAFSAGIEEFATHPLKAIEDALGVGTATTSTNPLIQSSLPTSEAPGLPTSNGWIILAVLGLGAVLLYLHYAND